MRIPIQKSIATALVLFASVAVSQASEFTKGVVKKVDRKQEKVTIIHEELKSLDMPAMTMVFRTADPAMLDSMKEGDAIEFVAERVNGKLTVTQVK